MKFNNITDFTDYFKDEDACRLHFEQTRFKNGTFCAHCGHKKVYRYSNGKRFRCSKCKKDFTVKTNTIFGESNLPIRKWYIAIYLLTSHKKGISSIQMAKYVGVTQKTAWFMDQRIRETMKSNNGQLFGSVEVDETYVGGKEKNKRTKGTQGRNTKTKTAIVGSIQRGGEARAEVVDNVKMKTIEKYIIDYVSLGANLYTDEFLAYSRMGDLYSHKTVVHGEGVYVSGEAHTNSIESFWAIFKRGHYGTYHYMSKKHLQRYVDEFVYRHNQRKSQICDIFSNAIERALQCDPILYSNLTRHSN